MKCNTRLLTEQVRSNLMGKCTTAVITEAFVNALPFNKDEMLFENLNLANYAANVISTMHPETLLDRALESTKNNPNANLYIKNLKAAIERTQQKPKNSSYISSHNSNVRQAEDYKMQGNKDKELSTLLNAADKNSNDYWASYYLAEFYRKNKDYGNALTYYQKTLNSKPTFTQCYLDMAIINFENKSYNLAIQNINKYLETNPKSDTAYALRAKINLSSGNLDLAEQDIKQAMQLNNDISYNLINAKILYYKKDYENSRKNFEILSNSIKTSEVYKYIGLCDYELGNYANALLNLDKAIILSDDDKTLDLKYNEIKKKLETKNET